MISKIMIYEEMYFFTHWVPGKLSRVSKLYMIYQLHRRLGWSREDILIWKLPSLYCPLQAILCATFLDIFAVIIFVTQLIPHYKIFCFDLYWTRLTFTRLKMMTALQNLLTEFLLKMANDIKTEWWNTTVDDLYLTQQRLCIIYDVWHNKHLGYHSHQRPHKVNTSVSLR